MSTTLFAQNDPLWGVLKIQFPFIIFPREARGKTGLPSQRHGMSQKEIIEFLEPPKYYFGTIIPK